MRQPGPKTLIPDAVLLKTSGVTIEIKGDSIMVALVSAIGEDFMHPTPGGATDVISAAAEAATTLAVVKAAGLKLVDADPDPAEQRWCNARFGTPPGVCGLPEEHPGDHMQRK